MDTKKFCNKHGIKIGSDYVSQNPNNPDWKDASHYKCVLKCKGKQMTTYFSMGLAHTDEPKAHDVIDCLASDSSSVENASSFEDWASDFGYDTDSRKAEKIYNACLNQSKKLKQFLGDELYEELLYKVERL